MDLLDFQKEILTELASSDALLVTSRGIGLWTIIKQLVRVYCDPQQLVLLLGATAAEQSALIDVLSSEGIRPLPKVVDNEFSASERHDLYLAGGVLMITSRILVVDLLAHRISPHLISGIIICNAHRVTEGSQDAFILRLFRQGNQKAGFIKAFSDSAEDLVRGFSKLEKIMKNLHLGRVLLYPRFHVRVCESLEKHAPDVVQLFQPLTPSMKAMQECVLHAIQACIQELKSANKALDIGQVTVEGSLHKSFDSVVRHQLDPIWHSVSQTTRNLVSDLTTLRRVANHMIRLDCVSFQVFLEQLRQAESHASSKTVSMWLLMEAGSKLFQLAKDRVYLLQKGGNNANDAAALLNKNSKRALESKPGEDDGCKKPKTSEEGAENVISIDSDEEETKEDEEKGKEAVAAEEDGVQVQLVLEENPKWLLLATILEEIAKDNADSKCGPPGPILVLSRDDRALSQLQEYLVTGGREMLLRLFRAHIWRRAQREKEQMMNPSGAASSNSSSSGVNSAASMARSNNASSATSLLSKAVWRQPDAESSKEAKRIEEQAKAKRDEENGVSATVAAKKGKGKGSFQPVTGVPEVDALLHKSSRGGRGGGSSTSSYRGSGSGSWRGGSNYKRGGSYRGGKGSSSSASSSKPMASASSSDDPSLPPEDSNQTLADQFLNNQQADISVGRKNTLIANPLTEDELVDEEDFEVLMPGMNSSSSSSSSSSLSSSSFSSSPIIVMQTHEKCEQVLASLRPKYIILHDPDLHSVRSIEMYKALHPGKPVRVYLMVYEGSTEFTQYLSIVREEKEAFERLIRERAMMVRPAEPAPAMVDQSSLQQQLTSRRGGGKSSGPAVPPRVIVDMREFRSALPSMLHARGFEVMPITLEVADYVLTPDLCLERKSVPDLIQSMTSGRLYNQATAMTRHYQQAGLLIEFDPQRSFSLQSTYEIGPEISTMSISSKLSLLLLHFPQLRLFWSRNAHATADLVAALKAGRPEPDADKAAAIGAAEAQESEASSSSGQDACDILKKVPGVTRDNMRSLMLSFGSLREISQAPLSKLEPVMGARHAAMLHSFFNRIVDVP